MYNKDTAIDYGAGSGYFTEILSKHFRMVYAIEAEERMVSVLKGEMKKRKIENVEIVQSEAPVKIDFPVDFILSILKRWWKWHKNILGF